MVNINGLERDGLRQAELCPRHTMMMNTNNTLIPDRPQPGITITAPTVRHRNVADKYATGVPKIKKIRGRENIAVGTWNVKTLRPAGKLEQLTHAMSRYHWNIVGLCEMRWKNFGKMSTDDGHNVYLGGEEGKHEDGVGFLVHKDVMGAVLGCQPVSNRLISIRLRPAPFNITIKQVYAPTSGHDDSEVDHFYQQLQEAIDQTSKKDILVVQGDWNAKVGKDAQADWRKVCGPYYNVETNERGLRLLEFATFNNLVLTNTLGPHKPSRRWTWHSPDRKHHTQTDYILVKKRFRSDVEIPRTRSLVFLEQRGWSGGAKVLGKLSVPGRPTYLDDSRARAYFACSRCGWGVFGHFFSHLSFLFSFSLSLGDGPI